MKQVMRDFIEEYKGSDFNTRLNFYMQHPEFRSDFLKIEQKEVAYNQFDTMKRRTGIKRFSSFLGGN